MDVFTLKESASRRYGKGGVPSFLARTIPCQRLGSIEWVTFPRLQVTGAIALRTNTRVRPAAMNQGTIARYI